MKDGNKQKTTRFGRILRLVQKYVNATVSPYEVHATNLKKFLLLDREEDVKKAIGE